jgi:hypothetical protein
MKPSSCVTVIGALFLLVNISCKEINKPIEPNNGQNPCSELAGSNYEPIHLNKILCIGKDSIGTFYVVDSIGYTIRCFVSHQDTLYRKNVGGSSIINERDYSLMIGAADYFKINFQCFAGIWTDISLCQEGAAETSYTLTSCKQSDISNCVLMNFPPTTHIEYLARQADGNYILVTRKEYDWDGTVVVHYGMPDNMKMRQVVSFLRGTDTYIHFMINSTEAIAYFGAVSNGTSFQPGEAYLQIGDVKNPLERTTATEDILKSLGFDCWQQISQTN